MKKAFSKHTPKAVICVNLYGQSADYDEILSIRHEYGVPVIEDATLLLSNENVVKICCDKTESQKFFEENGFGVPNQISVKDVEAGNYKFLLFIKPADGSSGINTYKISNEEELRVFIKYIENPIIQEFIHQWNILLMYFVILMRN